MTRRLVPLIVALVLGVGLAACSADDPEPSVLATTTTSTSTTIAPTTTSEPPPTTLPPPALVALATTTAPAAVSPGGVVVPILERRTDEAVVGTPCSNVATLREGYPIPAAGVVLDPGHGGAEPGAVGPSGLTEKEVNLAVSEFAKAVLDREGIPTVLTRTSDYRITLDARAKIVTTLGPAAFVSVHHNAEPDEPWPRPGTETYYQVGGPADAAARSKRLAGLIWEEIVKALSQFDAQWVADRDAGAKYRKSSRGDDYYGILRRTQGIPAVLSEAGFMNNPSEEALFAREDVRRAEGEAIARAIVRFLRSDDPGSGYTEPYPRETPAGPGGGSQNCQDPPL